MRAFIGLCLHRLLQILLPLIRLIELHNSLYQIPQLLLILLILRVNHILRILNQPILDLATLVNQLLRNIQFPLELLLRHRDHLRQDYILDLLVLPLVLGQVDELVDPPQSLPQRAVEMVLDTIIRSSLL